VVDVGVVFLSYLYYCVMNNLLCERLQKLADIIR